LTDEQQAAVHPGVRLTDTLYQALHLWIERHYRDDLSPGDLADPHLLIESRAALDELTGILHLPPLYPFQQT
jgi:succinylarginine dihydrolase